MKDFINKNWKLMTILVASVLIAYGSVLYFGKDNPVEEEIEKVIEFETGIKIDLTP